MRLLYLNDHGGIQLTDDLVDGRHSKIPDYAILSHTWLDEEHEVTFNDLTNGTGADKAGYNKLRFCLEQAARDGLHYCWVDTCCIKRTNSVEVQHSINSMFGWYRCAAKCYVYLSDVSASQDPWQPAFQNSRWFTRGWTLQELFAPRIVHFFSKEGNFLGAKSEAGIQQLIHDITDIPITALEGTPLAAFEVEERLSWTRKRTTKWAEDKAYSLIGFFGFYMPLLYGEGEDVAFQRLRHYIERYCQGGEKKGRALASNICSKQQLECLRSLYFEGMDYGRDQIEVPRETSEWIFKEPRFLKWRNSSRGLFWIKGDPAVGKSVLMRYLVEHMPVQPEELVISYFISSHGPVLQKSLSGVRRALLFHLLGNTPEALNKLAATFADREARIGRYSANKWIWEPMDLHEALLDALTEETRPITIFLDAVDEMEDSLAASIDFIVQLTARIEGRQLRVKICISSRVENRLLVAYRDVPSVSISGAHNQAIEWYIQQRLRHIEPRDRREKTEEQMQTGVKIGFLWARLMVHSILEGYDRGDSLKDQLDQIASSLDDRETSYDKMLSRG